MSKETTMGDRRIAEILEENRLLKELQGQGVSPEVLLYVSDYAPQVVVAIGKDDSIVLEPNTKNTSALVPYDVYLKVKRTTDWFQKGYLYTDDEEDLANPNLILDVREWIRSRTEAQIKKDINEITSEGALNSLYEYTEAIMFRQDDERRKTGKILVVRQEAMERMSSLFDYTLVEDSPE
jgi:hypothetical protein